MPTPNPEHDDKDSFVEAFKSIPPIPKAKNEPENAQPLMKPAEDYQYKPVVLPRLESMPPIEKTKNDFHAARTDLMQALHFSSKDLAMNREGDLAEGQKKRLTRSFLREMLVGGGFAIVLVGLAYVVPPKAIKGLDIEIPLVLAFLFMGLGWICVRSHRKTLAISHVVAFTGYIKKHSSPNESTLILTRHDQTERLFAVDETVYTAFIEGETYRLYCPSFSETTLLSAEPVPADPKWSA